MSDVELLMPLEISQLIVPTSHLKANSLDVMASQTIALIRLQRPSLAALHWEFTIEIEKSFYLKHLKSIEAKHEASRHYAV